MDRKEVIKKARECKERGGVGPKTAGMSYCKDEPITKCLRETKRILKILETT